MDSKTLHELYEKYRAQELTPAERETFYNVLADPAQESLLNEVLDEDWSAIRPEEFQDVTAERADEIFESLITRPERTRRLWPRIVAAASILLAISAGGYFVLHQKQAPPQTAQLLKHDVAPGGTQAILTLSNGQKIVLNNQQGQIASQGKTNILLNAKGNIHYQVASGESPGADLYNTLTVPIGNHRDMVLADGTEVSLDAGSTITYPVAFNGAERRVSITGQAYFKVKHDSAHPFFVQVKGLTIQDIGTEFNINAYDDESAVKTTLVEGSVKVNNTLLKPGQQAVAGNDQISVKDADLEVVTAWRDNNFLFRNQTLKTTMRQIARWYNVTVDYENAPENLRIAADISREHNLSVILHAIERTGKVKFKIEGKTVTVSR